MKQKLLCFLLCSLLPCIARAQLNNGYILVDGESPSSYCLPEKQTLTLTVNPDLLDRGDLDYFSWVLLGDLVLADGSGKQDTATTITIRSNGYGKGVVRLAYNTGNCTASTEIDIFKQFNPADIVPYPEILGPECISAGDTVVYSVNPLLTVNLYDRIGMDNYYWNITGDNKPAFVDTVLYTSGDGSSVTFIVGEVTDDAMLSVQIGQCNAEWPVTRTLSKAAPAPVLPDTICLSYDATSFTLNVENTQTGVVYDWYLPSSRWSYTYNNESRSNVTITLPEGAMGEVVVLSSYANGEACNNSMTTVYVNRSWGQDVNTSVSSSCVTPLQEITVSLLPNGLPDDPALTWDVPTGWVVPQGYGVNNAQLHVQLINPISLVDTFRVSSPSCNDKGVDEAFAVVYIKPDEVKSVTGEECLVVGEQYEFSVVLAGNGPAPVAYRWLLDGKELPDTGETVVVTATVEMTTLSVQPLGLNDCNGEVFTKKIAFKPAAPAGIEIEGNKCIAYNMPDTVTFAIEAPQPNQQYGWDIPQEWTLYSEGENGTTATVITNGVAGTYTIEAYGAGEGTCGQSEKVSMQVEIEQSGLYIMLGYSMSFPLAQSTYFIMLDNALPTNVPSVTWAFFDNGVLVPDVIVPASYLNTQATISGEYSFGDLTGNTQYTIVAIVTLEDGCTSRIVYGAPLSDEVLNGQIKQIRRQVSVNNSNNVIHLTPNPTQGDLQIDIDGLNGIANLVITNLQGKIVMQNNNFSIGGTCDTSTFPTGQYIVSVQQEGERYVGLFLKK